jgi:hypothetical protein
MNFLTHYYCDRKKEEPYYNLGLAIPDLMSMFKRGWKINNKFNKHSLSADFLSIADGITQHLQADSYFHQSDFFLRYTSRIKQLMLDNEIKYRGTHYLFLSHLLLEICIDRVIVINLPHVVKDFYADMSGIQQNTVNDFFKEIEVVIPEGFFIFYERFVREKFLYAYDDIEKVIFMYNRILTRINMTVIDPEEYEKLSNVIKSIDDLLNNELIERAAFNKLTSAKKTS